MSNNKKIIAYRLVPVYEPELGSISTACVMTCAATGDVISNSGGGGQVIAPDVHDALVSGNLREVFRD